MKYISTALLLFVLMTAGLSLVSCSRESGSQPAEKAAISSESQKSTSLEEEMEEIERQAEMAREMLIESLKSTGSDPSSIRGLNSNQVNLNATEGSGADEE